MRDDYGLGALPTESLVRITMDDCVLSNKCLSGEIDECEKLRSIEFKDCEIVFEDCRLLESIFALIDVFKTMESLEEVIFQDCTIREGDNEHSFNYKRKVIKYIVLGTLENKKYQGAYGKDFSCLNLIVHDRDYWLFEVD